MKSRTWLIWTAILSVALGAVAAIGYSQDKKSYELTENQRLRLEVQQSRFALAQEHFQQAVASFNGEVKAVEKENGWPEDSVQFDPNTLSFHEVSKPPATPAKEHEKPATKNP
jgi:hypothetical protein